VPTDMQHAPGNIIELRRLPGVRFEVVALWKREAFGGRAVFMAELRELDTEEINSECFFLWLNDEHETLFEMTTRKPWEEPQSSAILGDEA